MGLCATLPTCEDVAGWDSNLVFANQSAHGNQNPAWFALVKAVMPSGECETF